MTDGSDPATAAPTPAAEPRRAPHRRPGRAVHTIWPLATIGAAAIGAAFLNTPAPAPAPPPPSATSGRAEASPPPAGAPTPLLAKGHAVDWWFAYKFSAQTEPTTAAESDPDCMFGGHLRRDRLGSQHYAVASKENPNLVDGKGLIGTTTADPLGATFDQLFNGNLYYVVWNDQFKNDPHMTGPACGDGQCGSPWGHSKGMLAWDQDGNGVMLQVTTPSWPGSGNNRQVRADGNTLGCISDDDNISNAQDFFSLRLNHDDVKTVLRALAIASVSTDIGDAQLVGRRIPGKSPPPDLDALVAALGKQSNDKAWLDERLSSGVRLIAKPSALHVPPWQFVSSILGGENLLTATWWANPKIASTRSAADVHCWDGSLTTPPGRVDVAYSSTWNGKKLAFTGGPNHAKVGASLADGHHYAIFGDLNQQGSLGDAASPNGPGCKSSQNGRGGMFFVVADPLLSDGVLKLIAGTTAAYPN